jgi:RNA-binding protein 39
LERRRQEREKEDLENRKKREIDDLTKDQRTIFVSQLIVKAKEQDLENFFNQIGRVKSIIMVRDKQTGRHKGFAYVEMAELESIPNCLLFNEVVPDFQKFPILVKASEAEKNFLARKEVFTSDRKGAGLDTGGPDARLYIGNIHVSIDDAQLRSVLEQFGPTETIKLHRDHLGNSKGFAFIKYMRAESAALAMTSLAGTELAGRPLKVGPVIDQKTNPAIVAAASMNSNIGNGQSASGNWKLDSDDGGAGMTLNAQSRVMLMAKLGEGAGIQVPVPLQQANPYQNFNAMNNNSNSYYNNNGINNANNNSNNAIAPPPVSGIPSLCVLICNMFDPSQETAQNWELDIKEDVMEECNKYGAVDHCVVEKNKPGGMVFLKFRELQAAIKTANSMNGRFFAKRMITATFLEEKLYYELIYSS